MALPSANLNHKRGIMLEIGPSLARDERFIYMDKYGEVDVLHDPQEFPYPLDDSSCMAILCKSIGHIKPWLTIDFFNELWRVMKPSGNLIVSTPYAGSHLFWSDPMNCNGFIESTFLHFDRSSKMWGIYPSKPWIIKKGFPVWQTTGVIEVVLVKDSENE